MKIWIGIEKATVRNIAVGAKKLALWTWKQIELRDLLIFGGLSIASYGISSFSYPVALVVFGLGLFAVGYFGLPRVGNDDAE